MSEMVERTAKAGFMAWAYGRIVDEADERFKEDWPVVKPMWLRAQTAAIEAMRDSELTWDMRGAAVNVSDPGPGEPPLYEKIWRAMIAAALSPSREDESAKSDAD